MAEEDEQKGDQGPRGRQGDVGRVGDTGKTGDTGQLGREGKGGKQGEIGDSGERGAVGERGDMGERGAVGERGVQGPTGPQGDPGFKGPEGEHQRAVIEQTLQQVQGQSVRRQFWKGLLAGMIGSLLVMIPVSIIVGNELASVGDIQKVADQNCDRLGELAIIFEEDERAEAAASQQFLKNETGKAFGLSPKELQDAIAAAAARDALKISRLQRLARTDCPGRKFRPTTTSNISTTPQVPTTTTTTPKAP